MRKITYVCDKCGKTIEGPKYQLGALWTELDTGADLCEDCFRECDDMISWFVKHPSHHFSYSTPKPEPFSVQDSADEHKSKAEKTREKKAKGGRAGKKDLDLGKIAAIRDAGWTLDATADETGCFSQTIANRLPEAYELIKENKEAAAEND